MPAAAKRPGFDAGAACYVSRAPHVITLPSGKRIEYVRVFVPASSTSYYFKRENAPEVVSFSTPVENKEAVKRLWQSGFNWIIN